MMADAAVKATDRQFEGLLASGADINLHPFTFPEIPRNKMVATYIRENYRTESQIKNLCPDALIITGANVSNPRLETQPFWQPLQEIIAWSQKNIRSTLCSCLASHAVLQFQYQQRRHALPEKIWGVYDHKVQMPDHFLAAGLPPVVPVPQSRHNEVSARQFREAGLDVIIAGDVAGVHLAASSDNRLVMMQGHPEYDGISLLKEYKREVMYFAEGKRNVFPPLPRNILNAKGAALLEIHGRMVMDATTEGSPAPAFPESEAQRHLHENWHPAAARVFSNWLDSLVR